MTLYLKEFIYALDVKIVNYVEVKWEKHYEIFTIVNELVCTSTSCLMTIFIYEFFMIVTGYSSIFVYS